MGLEPPHLFKVDAAFQRVDVLANIIDGKLFRQ